MNHQSENEIIRIYHNHHIESTYTKYAPTRAPSATTAARMPPRPRASRPHTEAHTHTLTRIYTLQVSRAAAVGRGSGGGALLGAAAPSANHNRPFL